MIHFFICGDTAALLNNKPMPRFKNIERFTRRKMLQLAAATELNTLRIPPVNHLEMLKGNPKG